MKNRIKKYVALMLTVVLLTSIFPTMTISSAESEVSFDGSFAKSSYTMELGETLDVKVNASVTNANLTRVTVNVDSSGVDRLTSKEVSGSDWSGSLTLDSSVYPLNTPGTYTIKLFASADAGTPNWAELDQATLVVTEPEITIDGSFGKSSYTMEVNDTLDIKVKAHSENANLTRITVNVDGSGIDRHDSKEISGTSWSGRLTLDSSVYPLNTPGTYTIKLFASVDAGNPNWAEVDRATLFVTEAYEEPEKLADPVVTVTVDGTTMIATWDAVEGAERYVYSLRNLTDDDLIAEHIDSHTSSLTPEAGEQYNLAAGAVITGITDLTDDDLIAEYIDGRIISLTLEAGKQYKLAVGAVPAGVTDTIANKTLLSWSEVTFEIDAEEEEPEKEPEKPADPVVTVQVDGTTMTAAWDAVEGAVRYVYSLRNLTDDQRIAVHEDASNRNIILSLEAGKQYRIAVAAVPAGVIDTNADTDKCSWCEVTFDVVSAFDVQNFTATPATLEGTSEPVSVNLAADIDVNASLTNLYFYIADAIQTPASVDANGHVTGTLVLPENGFYTVELHYTKEGKNYKETTTVAISNILTSEICDHSAGNYEHVLDETIAPVYSNIHEDTHCVQYSYRRYCKDCGAYIKNVDEGVTSVAHDFSNGNICACGYQKAAEYVDAPVDAPVNAPVDAPVDATISFSNISNGDTVAAGKDLNVSWTQVEGIDHYEFAARYTDESEQCVARKSVGLNTTAVVPSVQYNKTLQLWVGAFANSGDEEPVCSATIQVETTQVETTVCDHPDGWTFDRFEDRYVNVDETGHVKQRVMLFNINCGNCSICGAKLQDYEDVVKKFDKEAHDFSDGNTCVCGYVKDEEVCDHSAGNYERVLDESIDSVGKVSFNGYNEGDVTDVDVSELSNGLTVSWKAANAESYTYKAILMETKPTGASNEADTAEKTLKSGDRKEGITRITIPLSDLPAGYYVKIAVHAYGADGSESANWPWIGFRITDKSKASTVAFDDHSASSVTDVKLSSLTNGLTVTWNAENAVKYSYKAILMSTAPTGANNESANALDVLGSGTGNVTSLTIPQDQLTEGSYVKVAVAAYGSNGKDSGWVWIGFKVVENTYYGDAAVEARMDDLYAKLGGPGFFTVDGQSCTSSFEKGHDCDNCFNKDVLNAAWFKSKFGSISCDWFPTSYGSTSEYTQTGWSCLGFAHFAEYWLYRDPNNPSSKVSTKKIGTYNFNEENATTYAQTGDVIRFGSSHSAICYYSDSDGMYVLDCNWGMRGEQCRVDKHYIPYSRYTTFTISRAYNAEE